MQSVKSQVSLLVCSLVRPVSPTVQKSQSHPVHLQSIWSSDSPISSPFHMSIHPYNRPSVKLRVSPMVCSACQPVHAPLLPPSVCHVHPTVRMSVYKSIFLLSDHQPVRSPIYPTCLSIRTTICPIAFRSLECSIIPSVCPTASSILTTTSLSFRISARGCVCQSDPSQTGR